MPPESHQEELAVRLRGLVPTPSGSGVFLEADDKVIAIFIDSSVAASIGLYLQGIEKPRPKVEWQVGELVRVKEGPFTDFNGAVEDVNYEKSKVRVSVTIFGRATPVELDFSQVEKI